MLAGVVAGAALIPAATGEESRVVITGGADETQHQYTWKVTNRSGARIVRIEFPQYGADLFYTPANWKQGSQKEMNLVNVGWKSKESGLCWAEPVPPYPGLAPGATAEFGMRIAGMGALRSTGTVRVKFDDASECAVAGVELPQMPARTSPYLAPLAMGGIFVIFVFVREFRRRRRAESASATSDGLQESSP